MPEKFEVGIPPQENEKNKSNLNQVFQILNTDAIMMCQRMRNTLDFYSLFDSEQAAKIAHDKLTQLGQQPRLENRKISLTAQFPKSEIDKLANTFNSIPKEKD